MARFAWRPCGWGQKLGTVYSDASEEVADVNELTVAL